MYEKKISFLDSTFFDNYDMEEKSNWSSSEAGVEAKKVWMKRRKGTFLNPKESGLVLENFSQLDYLIILCNFKNNHWYLMLLDVKKCTVSFYDSGGNGKSKRKERRSAVVLDALEHWCDDPPSSWTVDYKCDCPIQENSYDCGVYVILLVDYLCSTNAAIQKKSFTSSDATLCRKQIALMLRKTADTNERMSDEGEDSQELQVAGVRNEHTDTQKREFIHESLRVGGALQAQPEGGSTRVRRTKAGVSYDHEKASAEKTASVAVGKGKRKRQQTQKRRRSRADDYGDSSSSEDYADNKAAIKEMLKKQNDEMGKKCVRGNSNMMLDSDSSSESEGDGTDV
jgi:hypothetical protein